MIEIGTQTHSKRKVLSPKSLLLKKHLTKSKKKRKKERRDHLV
jgi:hypothetical protein